MIHLYCGNGKGKTTAAMGLALRMAGRGNKVLIVQFLKTEDSGERKLLAALPGVTLLPLPEKLKFLWHMNAEERAAEQVRCQALLEQAVEQVKSGSFGLLVLDELCGAVDENLIDLSSALSCLDLCERLGTEIVMTGQNPREALLDRADYVTEMKKVRHPFDFGASARMGVEF